MILRSKYSKRGLLTLLILFSAARQVIAGDDGDDYVLTALQSSPGNYRHIAYVDPSAYRVIGRYALDARMKFMADPALYSNTPPAGPSEPRVIGDWRERVFRKLRIYAGPRPADFANESRLPSENELDEQANEKRMVNKLVLKETLKFTRERVPEIDRLVKALRLEVSNRAYRESARAEANAETAGDAGAVKKGVYKDTLSLKTGLLARIEDGSPGFAAETEARYGRLYSFYKIDLDGHNDNSVGLMYIIDRDFHLQLQRAVTRATDPLTGEKTNEKSSLNLVQLVYQF